MSIIDDNKNEISDWCFKKEIIRNGKWVIIRSTCPHFRNNTKDKCALNDSGTFCGTVDTINV